MDYKKLIASYPELFSNESALIRVITDPDEIAKWQEYKFKDLERSGNPPEWANIGSVFEDPYVIIIRDLVEFPGGYRNGYIRLYNRAYLEGGAAVVVMLSEKDGKILLIRHYRHATRMFHWEIPRGFGSSGVDAISQAKMELFEEVNGEVVEMIDLGVLYQNTGLDGNPVNVFLARMDAVGEVEYKEGINELIWVSVPDLEKMIADSDITDGFTIAAYTKAKLKGLI